jgi:type II secretory pathway pseudopilin PulG
MNGFLKIKILAAATIAVVATSTAIAAPSSSALSNARNEVSIVQQARVVCRDNQTGRIIHYGRCHARVFCKDRYGNFLHWGRCD